MYTGDGSLRGRDISPWLVDATFLVLTPARGLSGRLEAAMVMVIVSGKEATQITRPTLKRGINTP